MEDNQNPKAPDGSKQVEPRPEAPAACASIKAFGIHWKIVASVFIGIAGFITASVIVWQGAEWIRKSVDDSVTAKLSDERVLRQIAAQIKPSLIFDGKESIISDMGASQFVKDIHVTKRTKDGWIERIQIDFTRPFANAPILTALHDSVGIYSERGRMLSWEFEIGWIVEPSDKDDKDRLYRLELIP